MINNPLVWLGEVAGAAYLIYLWRSHVRETGAVRRFLRDGKVALRG
jgi:hypothetical protein